MGVHAKDWLVNNASIHELVQEVALLCIVVAVTNAESQVAVREWPPEGLSFLGTESHKLFRAHIWRNASLKWPELACERASLKLRHRVMIELDGSGYRVLSIDRCLIGGSPQVGIE